MAVDLCFRVEFFVNVNGMCVVSLLSKLPRRKRKFLLITILISLLQKVREKCLSFKLTLFILLKHLHSTPALVNVCVFVIFVYVSERGSYQI